MTSASPKLQARILAIAVLVLSWAATGNPALAQTGGAPPSPAEEPSSYETLFDQSSLGNVAQTAQGHMHAGERLMQQGEKAAKKALAAPTEAKRQNLENKALKAREKAAEEFTEAIGYDPDLLPAYAELGLAYRLQGKYLEALQTHVAALKQAPQDEANFKGWADSLLALNMLGDATQTYTRLATENPDWAAYLMSGLKGWLVEKQTDPGDLDPAHVDRLAAWIDQQEQSSG